MTIKIFKFISIAALTGILLIILTSCSGGGTDDKSASDNITNTTNCNQEITINVQSPEDIPNEGDTTADGYMINKILKVETNDQNIEITAEVCTTQESHQTSTSVNGTVDVDAEASLIPS